MGPEFEDMADSMQTAVVVVKRDVGVDLLKEGGIGGRSRATRLLKRKRKLRGGLVEEDVVLGQTSIQQKSERE